VSAQEVNLTLWTDMSKPYFRGGTSYEKLEGRKISGAAEWHFPVVDFKSYKRYIWNSDVLKVKILLEAKMR